MFYNLKSFIAFFVIILAASVISFNGSYNFEAANNPVVPNPTLVDTLTLPANPGPPNNGGSAGWAMFSPR